MAAPRRHEQTKGEGQGKPIGGEEICRRGLYQGARGVLLDEAIDDDDQDNCAGVSSLADRGQGQC